MWSINAVKPFGCGFILKQEIFFAIAFVNLPVKEWQVVMVCGGAAACHDIFLRLCCFVEPAAVVVIVIVRNAIVSHMYGIEKFILFFRLYDVK